MSPPKSRRKAGSQALTEVRYGDPENRPPGSPERPPVAIQRERSSLARLGEECDCTNSVLPSGGRGAIVRRPQSWVGFARFVPPVDPRGSFRGPPGCANQSLPANSAHRNKRQRTAYESFPLRPIQSGQDPTAAHLRSQSASRFDSLCCGHRRLYVRRYICSRVSIPRTANPCLSTWAVRSHSVRRLARCSGADFNTGQFS